MAAILTNAKLLYSQNSTTIQKKSRKSVKNYSIYMQKKHRSLYWRVARLPLTSCTVAPDPRNRFSKKKFPLKGMINTFNLIPHTDLSVSYFWRHKRTELSISHSSQDIEKSYFNIQNGGSQWPPTHVACMTTFIHHNISYNFVFGTNFLSLIVLKIYCKKYLRQPLKC